MLLKIPSQKVPKGSVSSCGPQATASLVTEQMAVTGVL